MTNARDLADELLTLQPVDPARCNPHRKAHPVIGGRELECSECWRERRALELRLQRRHGLDHAARDAHSRNRKRDTRPVGMARPGGPPMTRHHLARADAVTHTPAEDLTPCPGRCNAAYRRAQADYEDAYNRWADTIDANGRTDQPEPEHHGITFWPARPVWCTSQYAPSLDRYGQVTITETHLGCTERTSSALTHIKQLWRDVPRSGTLMMAEPSERHGTKEPPSPSPAFDETDALDRWLLQLQHHLAARLGHHRATSAPVALRYLVEHTTALLCDPDAEQIGRDIRTWERRLRSIVGAQQVTRMPGTCSACGARGMLRHGNAEDLVKCRSCSASWDWDTYHRDIVGQVAG